MKSENQTTHIVVNLNAPLAISVHGVLKSTLCYQYIANVVSIGLQKKDMKITTCITKAHVTVIETPMT
jgi:hypothetical protein